MTKRKTNWRNFGLGIIPSIIIAALFMWSLNFFQEKYHRAVIDNAPVSNYFDYQSVQFVAVEDGALIFETRSRILQNFPILWNDILRCSNGGEYRLVSTQLTSTTSPVVKISYKTTQWNYNEPFPYGQKCYVKSIIRMDVEGIVKKQEIETPEFNIPREDDLII